MINLLKKKEIPSMDIDPLLCDRYLSEEDEKMFDKIEKILQEKKMKNKRKPNQ